MFRQVSSRSIVSPQQIASFQTAIVAAKTQLISFQTAVSAASEVLQQILTTKELEALTLQKTELIQIMSDYINQRKTRVDTVDRLKILSTKIA